MFRKLFECLLPCLVSSLDASNTRCGAILSLDYMIYHKNCSSDERSKHFNMERNDSFSFRLEFVLKIVLAYWFSDSQSAIHFIENGSKKLGLQAIAIDIFETYLSYNISLFPRWIPRHKNQTADIVSKLIH